MKQHSDYEKSRLKHVHFVQSDDIDDAFVVIRQLLGVHELSREEQLHFDLFLDSAKADMHIDMAQYYEPAITLPELPQQVRTRSTPVSSTTRNTPSTSGRIRFAEAQASGGFCSSSDSEPHNSDGSTGSTDSIYLRLDDIFATEPKERQPTEQQENDVPSEETLQELSVTRDELQDKVTSLQGDYDLIQERVKGHREKYESLKQEFEPTNSKGGQEARQGTSLGKRTDFFPQET